MKAMPTLTDQFRIAFARHRKVERYSRIMAAEFQRLRYGNEFVESEHPRDEEGKFVGVDLSKKFDRYELQNKKDNELSELAKQSTNERTKRLAAQILRERSRPKPQLSMEQEAEIARHKEDRDALQKIENERLETLKHGLPEYEYQQAILRSMLSDRTPSQMSAYVKSAISWQSHDPAKSSIDYAVQQLKKSGIRLEQRGQNYSWYGKLPNGGTVRVGDHLGVESHDVDLAFDNDRPLTKENVIAWVAEEIRSLNAN
jgi:hypothetical protein